MPLQVLSQVPQEVMLGQEKCNAHRQQLPALSVREGKKGNEIKKLDSMTYFTVSLGYVTNLSERVVVRHAAVGLFDELTVHLILQLRVCQTHLQCTLGQRSVIVYGRRFH